MPALRSASLRGLWRAVAIAEREGIVYMGALGVTGGVDSALAYALLLGVNGNQGTETCTEGEGFCLRGAIFFPRRAAFVFRLTRLLYFPIPRTR